MPAPTSLAVEVDDVEYSRYERNRDTITVTVSAAGGAPYVNEPVILSLTKARRSRDAVVGYTTVNLNGVSDPVVATATFYLPDLVDQDLIHLSRHGRYFVQGEYEAIASSAVIGTVPDGQVYLVASEEGTVGNTYTVEVVVPAGTSPLSVSRVGDAYTINLAVNGGVPVGSENTAVRVRNAINATTQDVVATVLGSGTGSLSLAEGPTPFTGGVDQVLAESEDFDLRIVSVDRLKSDYLFGVPLTATDIKRPKFDPVSITGVRFIEVSQGTPEGFGTLTYNYHRNATTNASATIGAGVNGSVSIFADGVSVDGDDGNSVTVVVNVPAGSSGLTANYTAGVLVINLSVVAGVPVPAENTAVLVADVISALPEFTAAASGTGTDSLSTPEGPTQFTGGTTQTLRSLSWQGGPIAVVAGAGTYVLRAGSTGPSARLRSSSNEYVVVRVGSVLSLPATSVAEEILIQNQPMDDATLGRFIQESIDFVEHDLLDIRIEPTNVVSDRDPTTIQYSAGVNALTPLFADTDFDFIESTLTYFVPQGSNQWVQIWTPYRQLLRVDTLFGAIANTRVIDIDLEWIEHSEKGGLIQLVPFNQEIAFDFVGLLWVNAIRGAAELPNFWHFNFIVGLREAPGDIQELIGRLAAIKTLTALASAFRPGVGSMSLSRDGVSQSVSYINTQTYGIYTGAISAHQKWLEDNETMLKAKYRGLNWVVV